MKSLITLLTFLLSSILLIHAQNYVPFPEQNAVWSSFHSFEGQTGKGQSYCYNSYIYTNGDTLINGKKYIKLLEKKVYLYNFSDRCYNFIDSNKAAVWSNYGFLRNDTTNKKVYFRNLGWNRDTLLYTFDLKVGDTLPETYINYKVINQNNVFVGLIVDSISIENYGGVNRRMFYLNILGNIRVDSLIEGVGSVYGMFSYKSRSYRHEFLLNCLTVNNQFIYGSSGTNCQLTNVITSAIERDNQQSDNINVYPNPVSDQFKIETNQQQKLKEIELFDLTGKSVRIYNSAKLEFSVKRLTPGIYFLRIEEDNKLYTKKLIIQ